MLQILGGLLFGQRCVNRIRQVARESCPPPPARQPWVGIHLLTSQFPALLVGGHVSKGICLTLVFDFLSPVLRFRSEVASGVTCMCQTKH